MNQLYKPFFSLIFALFIGFSSYSQVNPGVYYSLNDALENPERVTVLDLSFQNISVLPDSFSGFINLRELRLVNSKLSILPNSVYQLQQLKTLNLQGNNSINQKALVAGLDSLDALENLDLSYCDLKYLEATIGNCSELKSLVLKGNYLFYLPASIGRLENLRNLNVADNLLSQLPQTFVYLENLESLDFGGNAELAVVEIFQLVKNSQINELYFRDQTFPNGLQVSPLQFQVLEFDNCQFEGQEIFENFTTQKLVLSYCQGLDYKFLFKALAQDSILSDFRLTDSVARKVDFRAFANSNIENLKLELVKLQNWNFTSTSMQKLAKLKYLDLSNNQMKTYPAKLNQLKNLAALNLSFCGLTDSRLNIEIPGLKNLDLRENQITRSEVVKIREQNSNALVSHDFMGKPIPAKSRPLPAVKQNIEWASLDSRKPNQLKLKTGTEIRIPENAFVTKDGKAVTGKVDFAVEEFKNATDIFLSGIPMTYDSAGVSYTFSSAGMMELRAYSQGEELELAPNTQLDIKMTSDQEGKYNLYSLDDSTGAWSVEETSLTYGPQFQRPAFNKVLSTFVQDSASWYASIISEFKRTRKEVITGKTKRIRKLNSFKINFLDEGKVFKDRDVLRFSELSLLSDITFIYEGMNFEEDQKKLDSVFQMLEDDFDLRKRRSGTRPIRSPENINNIIEEVRIAPNETSDNFILTIFYGSEKISFPVSIETRSNKAKSVQKEFSKFYKKYKRTLRKRKEEWTFAEGEEEIAIKEFIDQAWSRVNELGMVDQEGNVTQMNTFNYGIGGLGVINCDRPLLILPENPLAEIWGKYFDKETQKRIHPRSIFVLDYSQNYALNFYKKLPKSYEKSKVLLLVFLQNGNYGIVDNLGEKRKENGLRSKMDFNIEVFDNSVHFNDQLEAYTASLN